MSTHRPQPTALTAFAVASALVLAGALPAAASPGEAATDPADQASQSARVAWSAAETLSGIDQHGSYPQVAVGGGVSTVVWEGPDDPVESGARAVLSRQHHAGQPWEAAEPLGWGWGPTAAANGSGAAMVAWSGGTGTAPDQEIMVALRSADGSWESAQQVSDTPATRSAYLGGVALGDSGAAVVWWQDAVDDEPHRVNRGYVAYRNAAGVWRAPVKMFGTGPGHEMGAAIDAAGNVLVGYETRAGVFARMRVVGDGWRAPRQIAAPMATARLTAMLSEDGKVRVVAWQGDRFKARRYAGGWGPVRRLAPGSPTESDIVMDRAGHTTAGWVRGDSSVAALRWPRGKVPAAPVTVASVPADPGLSSYSPDLAVNDAGDVALGWQRDGGGSRLGRVQASVRTGAAGWQPWERVTPAGDDAWSFQLAVGGTEIEAAWSEWEPDPVISRVRYGTSDLL